VKSKVTGPKFEADDVSYLGNAKIAGLQKDLSLTGIQYNTAVTLFFVPYTVFEVPSNIILKLIRPSRWIAALMCVAVLTWR
jgi:hypothetical protein